MKQKTSSKPRHEYKLTLGRDIEGNLIRRSFYSKKSKSDARKKGERFRLLYEMEHCCVSEATHPKTTFETWAIECLELYKKPYVKGNTYSGTYLGPVKQRLIPHFGKMDLDTIHPVHIQRYINQLGDTYAPETIKKDFTILSFILQHAVDNGLCKSNPAKKTIHLPKIQPPEKKTYTQLDYDIAYQFAKEHPDGLSIMLLMETGITRSELLGLQWKDVDIENRVIHINQGLVAYQDLDAEQWKLESEGLKNRHRKRSIPLVDPVLVDLLAKKPRGRTSDHVFHSPKGQPYQPQNWSKRVFVKFQKDLLAEHPNLPELSPHELRHTRATLWLAQGISPLMVSKLLGHGDLKMLTKIYDHTSVETLRTALEQG